MILNSRTIAAAAVAIVVGAVLLGAQVARADSPSVAVATDRGALLNAVVDDVFDHTSANDQRYLSAGQLIGIGSTCWPCRLGPAVGAAALIASRPDLLPDVVAAIDRAIADHQLADGSFGDGIDTTWFANVIGMTYLLTAPRLDPATVALWTSALTRAADHLVAAGNLGYYTNGNINLAMTATMWFAARVTGDPRYASYYEASWAFTTAPPQGNWNGFGLRITTGPTNPDWTDGAGYLAESAGGVPGYDPEYIQLQADVAASLYVFSRDPRLLRLMNVLVNSVRPRIGPTMTLDTRNGVRKNGQVPFLTPALGLLVSSGERPDLAPLAAAQFVRMRSDYASVLADDDESAEAGFYRGVGTWLAVPVIDAVLQAPVPAPVTVAAPTPAPKRSSRRRSRPSACAAADRRVDRARTRRARRHAKHQLAACRARVRAERRRAARRAREQRRKRHAQHAKQQPAAPARKT